MPAAFTRDTVRRVGGAVGRYVRSAPGTFIWLAILFVTTIVAHRVGAQDLTDILRSRSTNLRHLMHDPVPSLVRSALWIDGNGWFLYALAYVAIHATVERWLGTARWLVVVVLAHVGATYISQSVLLWAIDTGRAPQSAINVIDIGVSYGLAGVAGILTYRLAWRWRVPYLVILAAICLTPVVAPFLSGGHPTFTDIGHLCSVLIGLASYPIIVVGRNAPRVRSELPPVSSHIVERLDAELPPVSPHIVERVPESELVAAPALPVVPRLHPVAALRTRITARAGSTARPG
ncbi:rhomboid-like protein [Williamsia sp. SKLECPSW1]